MVSSTITIISSSTVASVGLVAAMLLLGTADVLLVEKDLLPAMLPSSDMGEQTSSEAAGSSSSTDMQAASSVSAAASQAGSVGVRKAQGPQIENVLAQMQFETQNTTETTLIEQVLPAGITIKRIALLKDDDRAGLVAWIDSPDVQAHFLSLKEALHISFSTQVHDIIDETQRREGKPPRNLLTFVDPALSDERLVFIRVRERLYEFHVANGRDEVVFDLIEELTN